VCVCACVFLLTSLCQKCARIRLTLVSLPVYFPFIYIVSASCLLIHLSVYQFASLYIFLCEDCISLHECACSCFVSSPATLTLPCLPLCRSMCLVEHCFFNPVFCLCLSEFGWNSSVTKICNHYSRTHQHHHLLMSYTPLTRHF